MRHLSIKLPTVRQEIYVGPDIIDFACTKIRARVYTETLMLVDENVSKIHRKKFKQIIAQLRPKHIIFVPASESSKGLEFMNSILERCYKDHIGRSACIVAMGGGIVGDIAGFLSAVYMRGIDFVFLPTTLMAQGDTIINKVGISYKLLKNVVGSFHSPVLTICDTTFLQTLTEKEVSLGISEIVKHGLIQSRDFVKYLDGVIQNNLEGWQSYPWEEIVFRSLKIKKELVQKDPLDKLGRHKGLSYGHTLANALEGISDYRLRHGEAISIGMSFSGNISKHMGLLSLRDLQTQNRLLEKCFLPTKLPPKNKVKNILHLLYRDKIATDKSLTLVLLKKIGAFVVKKNIDERLVLRVLKDL